MDLSKLINRTAPPDDQHGPGNTDPSSWVEKWAEEVCVSSPAPETGLENDRLAKDDPEVTYKPWQKPSWQFRFLAVLAQTGLARYSCDRADISMRVALKWREKDRAFAEAWDEAITRAHEFLELVAYERATSGKSDRILIKLLEANMPEKYRNPVPGALGPDGFRPPPVIGYEITPPMAVAMDADSPEQTSETLETLVGEVVNEPFLP